ncbi:GMC oxidoreductase [Gammaproteobacteria bacterium]|nr:GMC oxidoreductase [Gammaproteobacteria bacterium]
MISDLNNAALGSISDIDYCIIGAGPAGITLALDLENTGKKILLLEAGSIYWTQESADCYKGINKGDQYFELEHSRQRFFGGTSNHWTGWCRTLDESDFLSSDISGSSWPIEKKDLDPFLKQSCEILEVQSDYTNQLLSKKFGIEAQSFEFSPPVRFGQKYKDKIEKSNSIHLIINANLTDLAYNNTKVNKLTVSSYSNYQLTIKAQTFILATGGIENSRLLLWLNKKNKLNIINKISPLGKYWMEHPHFYIGKAFLDRRWKNTYLGLNAAARKDLGILNAGIRIEGLGDEGSTALIKDIMCVAPDLGKKIGNLFKKNLVCAANIRGAWEQAPNINSSIEISEDSFDSFGIPRAILNWKKTDFDILTIKKTLQQINSWILYKNLGRLKYDDWIIRSLTFPESLETGGHHHMGGTRMGLEIVDSVVDKNLRVHEKENFYILGSSVFPTGGHANPTLTILQLTLRLSAHLKKMNNRALI